MVKAACMILISKLILRLSESKNKYFQKDVDERTVKFPNFNFKIFNDLQNIFSKEEISNLEKTNALY